VLEVQNGDRYELRITSSTEISRGTFRNIRLQDLRIGDRLTATLESGQLTKLHAVGQRTDTVGRLTEMRITQQFSEVTVLGNDGTSRVFIIMPGIYDVYTLRIGMDIRVFLDSREVVTIQVIAQSGQQTTAVLGYIQSIGTGQTLVVVDMDGQSPRNHTVVINSDTIDTATGQPIVYNNLRVNMNVYVVMVGPQSNIARSVTILP
jgi:hypothetical protein